MKKKAATGKKRFNKRCASREQLSRSSIAFHKELIQNGRVLCLDPSCGSASSMPGWAIFEKMKLVSAGTLELNEKELLEKRLRSLAEDVTTLLSESIDCVLIEEMPVKPITTKAGFRISHEAFNSLMQSVGACKAAVPRSLPTISMPASLWSRIARSQGWAANSEKYSKSDLIDAVRIGLAAIFILGGDCDAAISCTDA